MKWSQLTNADTLKAALVLGVLGGGAFGLLWLSRYANGAPAAFVIVFVLVAIVGWGIVTAVYGGQTRADHTPTPQPHTNIHYQDLATIEDREAQCAADLLSHPAKASETWGSIGMYALAVQRVEPTFDGAQLHVDLPLPEDLPEYLTRLPRLARATGAHSIDFVDITPHSLVLDVVTADPMTHPDMQALLANVPPSLHHALCTVLDPRRARRMWNGLGLGDKPNPRLGEPGSYLTVRRDKPIKKVPAGLHIPFQLPPNCAAKDVIAKLETLHTNLKVPDVRVVEAIRDELTLELRIVDPVAQIVWSPLISVHEVLDENGLVNTTYRTAVTPGSLSCYDDIELGIDEEGVPVTYNLADDGHLCIGGRTRSGKSILLNTLNAAAMLMRDVEVLMIDPNGAATPPWFELLLEVCEENDGAAACSVLDVVLEEIERRKPLLHKHKVDKIADIGFSSKLPMWVLVVDEAAMFRKHTEFGDKLAKIAAIALKYGIVLWVALQKVSEDNLPTAVRSQLSNKVTHAVNDAADTRVIMASMPGEFAAEMLKRSTPQGVAIALLASRPDYTRMRGLFLPSRGCWVIAQTILDSMGGIGRRTRPQFDDLAEELTELVDLDETTTHPTPSSPRSKLAPPHTDAGAEAAANQGSVLQLDDYRGESKFCKGPDCTNPLPQQETGRPGKFCSDECRYSWHAEERKRKRRLARRQQGEPDD